MTEIGKDISKARVLLDKGELVAIPTETVYGLAANAYNIDAVAKIFKVKNRPQFDPLIVHVANADALHPLVSNFPDQAKVLATRLWPGPLTLLLKKSKIVPDLVTAGMERVAIRVPEHSVTLNLLSQLEFPLVAPSANPFGYISPTTAQHVADQLAERIPYILDGGACEVGIESTIIGWENEEPVIYRLGGTSKEVIESLIGKVMVQPHSSSNPQAPGMLKSHYAPAKKVIVGNLADLLSQYQGKRVGVISFRETIMTDTEIEQVVLAPDGKIETAAKRLFSTMRQLDAADVDVILAEEVPNHGLGRAINDRLRRAAAPKDS
jgi:L-threonylcarbamoyladenylate synthase